MLPGKKPHLLHRHKIHTLRMRIQAKQNVQNMDKLLGLAYSEQLTVQALQLFLNGREPRLLVAWALYPKIAKKSQR